MLIHCLIGNCTRLSRQTLTRLSHGFSLHTQPACKFQQFTGNYRSILSAQQQQQRQLLLIQRKRPRLWLIRQKTTAPRTEKKPEPIRLRRLDVVRLVKLAKSEKVALIAAIGCLVISSAITMSVPFALGKILDIIFSKDGTTANSLEKLTGISLILCGIFIIGGLANMARVYLFNSASLRIVRNLRSKVYRSMLNQETAWFDTKGTGELLNRLMTDTYFVGNSLSQNLSDGLRSTVMIIAGTTMMIITSAKLALVSTCVVPCVAGVAVIYGRYVRKVTRQLLDKFAGISKEAEERLGNVKTVKSFCKENEECKSYDNLLNDALDLGYKEVKARAFFYGMTGLSGNVIIISVLYYGGSLVINDMLTIGALTSFLMYAAYTGISINGLSNFYTELNKGIGAVQRLWDIMDRKYAIDNNMGQYPTLPPQGHIQFENVGFRFPSRPESVVLDQFNLTMMPGQTTAIVGRSGSGKTTLVTLLLRLYDPQSGRILLDGSDLRVLNPVWLRSHIGAVSQEPILFSGTIRDNILYGLNPGTKISDEQLDQIVRKAHVDQFAAELPQGLNTLVGQRGMMLSGGQKQRVAIARALIKNPTILILDEATSALDSLSEQLVQDALEELSKGRTVLTIAHRLSTIRNADNIAVLDNGRITEQGRFESLMSQGSIGTFRELMSKQAFLVNS